MARLNRYVNRVGYYVTNVFADGSRIKKVTYQVHSRAEGILESYGLRSGDEIPPKLFFNLVRDKMLYTHGGGPGDESRDSETSARPVRYIGEGRKRQIPLDITPEVLTDQGELISFGAFVTKFGGAEGYDLDTLRRAYSAKQKQFDRSRPATRHEPERPRPGDYGEPQQPPRGEIIISDPAANTPILLSERFERALIYATVIHAGQLRKATNTPYISHLLGVASSALEFGASESEAIGALLHDAGEDAGGAGRIQDIRIRFGEEVAAIVEGCTDTVQTPKPPWRKRKEDYIAHLGSADLSTLLVSASDKLHNARSILRDLRQHGDEVWSRFNGGKDGSLWYYRALVSEFRKHRDSNSELIDELDRVVSEIEKLTHR